MPVAVHLRPPGRDRLLAEAATAWQQQTRIGDLIAGYGGEEFILLLPASIVAEAVSTMERLRRHPARADLLLRRGHMGRRGDGRRTDRWGDAALYRAKAAGRDRIDVAAVTARTGGDLVETAGPSR